MRKKGVTAAMPKLNGVPYEARNETCLACPAGMACAAGIAQFSWGAAAGLINNGSDHAVIVHVGELYISRAKADSGKILLRLDKESVKKCPLYKLWRISSLPEEVAEWLCDAT